jgi:hypothetical protein
VMWVMWILVLDCLEMELVLVQDSCMVCAEHTICLETILDAPDETPRGHGSCRISFWSVWRWY